MDIIKFEYIYNEYATTNPPRSICRAYTLEDFTDDSVSLVFYSSYNGDEKEQKFRITNPEFSEISDFFKNDKIVEAIEEQCKAGQNRPPEYMAMCGGSTTDGINVKMASGEELSTQVIPIEANGLLRYIADLVKNNQPSANADKAWYCTNCGSANEGNFCTNCGNRRIHIMKG